MTDALDPVIAAMIAGLATLTDAFERAAATGVVQPGDARDRALATFAALHGTVLLRKQARRAPDVIDVDRLARLVIDSLLLGFGATRQALAAARRRAAAVGAPPTTAGATS